MNYTHAVEFNFCCVKTVPFGKNLYIVGSCDKLGYWDKNQALKLKWTQVFHNTRINYTL